MELNTLRTVSLTKGRPDADMTDGQWQEYFSIMKQMTEQGDEKRMKLSTAGITINEHSVNGQSEYHGETSYVYYCQFINSVLATIRGNASMPPSHDYCFYIYQIADLLHFEHDRLNVVWLERDKCFEVWLK